MFSGIFPLLLPFERGGTKAPAFPRRLRENDEFGSESKNISDAQSRSEDVWVPTYEPSELPLFHIALTLEKRRMWLSSSFGYM